MAKEFPKLMKSDVDLEGLKDHLKLNNKQLAYLLRVSHRSLERWLRGQPQPPWLEMVVLGATTYLGSYEANGENKFVDKYDSAIGNQRATIAQEIESL